MTFGHFIIRLPVPADAESIFEMVHNNRTRLSDYFPVSVNAIKDTISAINYVEEKIKQAERKEAFTFLIFDSKARKPAGMIFIKSIDWRIPKAELAYYIGKDYERQGIVTAAVAHIADYCFESLKMNKLFLRAAHDNLASKRVAEKNGFVLEGTLRKDFKTSDGRLIDLLYYGLVKE